MKIQHVTQNQSTKTHTHLVYGIVAKHEGNKVVIDNGSIRHLHGAKSGKSGTCECCHSHKDSLVMGVCVDCQKN